MLLAALPSAGHGSSHGLCGMMLLLLCVVCVLLKCISFDVRLLLCVAAAIYLYIAVRMSYMWLDPPCPIVAADGIAPQWLLLRPYPGGGRDWYCSLCQQWAVSNHLSGRRHQNRLWLLSERSCSPMLASDVPAARSMRSSHFREQCVHSQQPPSVSSGGSPLGIGASSSSLGGDFPVPILGADGLMVSQITSMSHFATSCLRSYLFWASSRLGKLSAELAHAPSTASPSPFGLARDNLPTI